MKCSTVEQRLRQMSRGMFESCPWRLNTLRHIAGGDIVIPTMIPKSPYTFASVFTSSRLHPRTPALKSLLSARNSIPSRQMNRLS